MPAPAASLGGVVRVPMWCVWCLLLLATAPAWGAPQVVRVGVYQNPPKIFLAGGRISGIFGDLLHSIAEREHWRLEPVTCEWQQCLDMLRDGRIDLMPDVAFTKERARTMGFGAVPALYSWSEIYRNAKTNLMSIKDMQGKRIAVLKGSIQQAYLQRMVTGFGLRSVTVVPVDNLAAGFRMAASGAVDAVATNNFFGDAEAPRYHLESTPIMFQPSQLYFAAAKGRNADVLNAIDRHLSAWEAGSDSLYYRILEHWRVTQRPPRVPVQVWWVLGALAVLLLAALGAMFLQRRQVMEKTRNLRITEDKLAVILDNIDSYIYIKDTDLRYQYVNRKVADLFGVPRNQVLGQRDDIFFDADTVGRIHATDRRVLDVGQPMTFENETSSRDATVRQTYLTVKQPLRDTTGKIYALCGISTDFTEHRRNQERIHQLAFYDPLTELPNRRLLLDRAEHALNAYARTHSEGALLFIDLDNFKVLNDTQGHSQGDVLLAQVARRLGQDIRQNDTLARLGGDEFVLLMEELGDDPDKAIRDVDVVARKLLKAFAEPYQLDHRIYNITASIGVAMFSDADNKVDELLRRADMAMYEAKASGRNLLKFFNPHMQASLTARAAVEADLHAAMKQQQFVLHYQPQVDSDGRIVGAEALIRWQHPDKGMIPPCAFIPVAELTGQILSLGRWILETACLQLVEWSRKPGWTDLVLAVNVSPRQFHHPDFVTEVLGLLDETGANPARLELELTESLLADDVETLIDRMRLLKARGVRFSLDDFGTGYSSLSYLKRLPLDQLKIDQSFVRDLLTDPNDAAIVKTVLALGESLDLAVIAEGVETVAQRDALIGLGCHRQQGYLFGRPGPAEALGIAAALSE